MKYVLLRSISQAAFALSAVLIVAGQAWPQSQDWEAKAQKKVDALIQKNGSGTNLELQKRLLQMNEEDQAIRRKFFDASADKQRELVPLMDAVDQGLTTELKRIVQKHGWPTIRLVGIRASQAALLILNHTHDHEFQRDWIPRLSKLVEEDEILGSDLAPIIDKLLLSDGKPQRFGLVFRFEGELMIMEPVEDPAHLEERRAKYLLMPMTEYMKSMENYYHKKLKKY